MYYIIAKTKNEYGQPYVWNRQRWTSVFFLGWKYKTEELAQKANTRGGGFGDGPLGSVISVEEYERLYVAGES